MVKQKRNVTSTAEFTGFSAFASHTSSAAAALQQFLIVCRNPQLELEPEPHGKQSQNLPFVKRKNKTTKEALRDSGLFIQARTEFICFNAKQLHDLDFFLFSI